MFRCLVQCTVKIIVQLLYCLLSLKETHEHHDSFKRLCRWPRRAPCRIPPPQTVNTWEKTAHNHTHTHRHINSSVLFRVLGRVPPAPPAPPPPPQSCKPRGNTAHTHTHTHTHTITPC